MHQFVPIMKNKFTLIFFSGKGAHWNCLIVPMRSLCCGVPFFCTGNMWYVCSGCSVVPTLDGVGWLLARVTEDGFRTHLLTTYNSDRIRKFQMMDICTKNDYDNYGLCCGFLKEEMKDLTLYLKQSVNNLNYLTGYGMMVLSNCECIMEYVVHGPLAIFVDAYKRKEFLLDSLKPEVVAKLKLVVERGMEVACRTEKDMGIKRTCNKDAWVRYLLERSVMCDDEADLRSNFLAYQQSMNNVIGLSAKTALARRIVATVCLIKNRRRP